MTGNAFEIFGNYIDDSENGKTECMGLLDFAVKRNMMKRKSGLVLGVYEDIEITGFHARFTEVFPGENTQNFIEVIKGEGMNPKSSKEGIVKNNFIGTSVTKKLIKKLCGKERTLAFEDDAIKAYKARLEDFKDKKVGIH